MLLSLGLRRCLLGAAAVSSLLLSASAQDLSFKATADTGVNYRDRARNYGAEDLRVEWDRHTVWHNVERSFMSFDLSGVQGQGFQCVTLRLNATGGGDTHFEVRLVKGAWSENDATWDTQPPTGAVVGSWTRSVTTGEVIEIPLSSALARRDGRVDLALVGVGYGGSDEIRFQSREDTSGPELLFGCTDGAFGAGFTSTTREGETPLAVRFQNYSSGDATSWLWDFGDGTTATTKGALHTYTTPGRYSVTLTSTGPRGTAVQTRPNYVFSYPTETDLGSVHDWKRISQTRGGGPPLDDEDMFGRSVDVLGDLDGDGIDDWIVGAIGDDDARDESGQDAPGRFDDNRGDNPGAVYILFMEPDGSVREHQKISNLYGNLGVTLDDVDGFGRYVAGIGDLDLDGVLDAVVTACRDDDGTSNQGAFYVLFLNPDGTVRDRTKVSETTGGFGGQLDNNDQFGRGVTSLGDLDGDGIQDLAVGAIGDDDGGSDRGAVWILFMNRDGTVRDEAKISTTAGGLQTAWEGRWFGMDVDLLGDVNGDGIPDIGVGTLLDDAWLHASGGAFVILLERDGSVKGEFYINAFSGMVTGELEPGDEFGGSIAGLGDLDGDGIPDMAVGSIRDDDNERGDLEIGSDFGALYVYFLNADGSVRDYAKISATRGQFDDKIDRYDRFAEGLGAGGDLNGDGIPDLIAGSRFNDDGGANKGSVTALFMNDGTLMDLMAGFSTTPSSGEVPLEVSFTDSSFGNVTGWSWDFGDGTTSTLASPTHTYLATGTFDVSLTVTGPLGANTRLALGEVTAVAGPAPAAAFDATPGLGVAPLAVAFTDRSTGFATAWSWDFGDGSSSMERSPVHTYTTPGSFTATLTATGPGGATNANNVEGILVGEAVPPISGFSQDVTSGEFPLEVSFTSGVTGAVEAFLWDFGDGTVSGDRDPMHVYTAAGTYDVSLTVSGPLGSDTATAVSAVTVDAAPAPVAGFAVSPSSGIAPLAVSFTDLSSGPITAWSWDFGNGATSGEAEPAHLYALPGSYDVRLTVTGPGGSSTLELADAVQVDGTVAMGLVDGGFEAQPLGAGPVAPWIPLLGGGHVIAGGSGGSDAGMPTEGAQWLEVSGDGSVAATGPSAPGSFTAPAQGAVGVSQAFRVPSGFSLLRFDASFLLGGAQDSPTDNDWMSVDVSDGTRTLNLFYADSFDEFSSVSTLRGLPSTAVTTVEVDLLQAFVFANETTDFLLTIQVGNGGDGATPSVGRVDDVRLDATPGNVIRLGCGLNPVGSLVVLAGQPWLSGQMSFGLDNPLGTQAPGAMSFLMLAFQPDPAYPCGSVFGSVGMTGSAGELLVSRVAPDPARIAQGSDWGGVGLPGVVTTPLPSDPGLVGVPIFAQGYLLDLTPGAQPRVGLTDGLELLLTAPPATTSFLPGVRAEYYTGTDFESLALVRTDAVIDLDLGTGAPDPSLPTDRFSVRWFGHVEPETTELYTFTTTSDDGVRLWVDGVLLVEDWTNHAPREGSGSVALEAGVRVPLVIEYYESTGRSTLRLEWETPTRPRGLVPAERLWHDAD